MINAKDIDSELLPFTFLLFTLLVSSVWQHFLNPLLVAFGNQRVNIEIAFSLARLFRQDMTGVRMSAFEFAAGGRAKTLCRAFMCF
jgi:hypothetical protein